MRTSQLRRGKNHDRVSHNNGLAPERRGTRVDSYMGAAAIRFAFNTGSRSRSVWYAYFGTASTVTEAPRMVKSTHDDFTAYHGFPDLMRLFRPAPVA
jgi:hypothetical protein